MERLKLLSFVLREGQDGERDMTSPQDPIPPLSRMPAENSRQYTS
jgi:hypothetical protein